MKRARGLELALAMALAALSLANPACYRVEMNLQELADGSSGSVLGGAGGESAECDDSPVDDVQESCRKFGLPSRAQCAEQDPDGWLGCYDGGCRVCNKMLRDYPYYLAWHPCCSDDDNTCNSNSPVVCNPRCPAPTERDRVRPCWLAPTTP